MNKTINIFVSNSMWFMHLVYTMYLILGNLTITRIGWFRKIGVELDIYQVEIIFANIIYTITVYFTLSTYIVWYYVVLSFYFTPEVIIMTTTYEVPNLRV